MCGTSLPRPPAIERESSHLGSKIEVPERPKIEVEEHRLRPLETFDSAEHPIPHSENDRGKWFDAEARTSVSDRETNPWNLRSTTSEQSTSTPVSGPSFLGLADEPRQSVSYLLEDNEPSGGRKFALVLLLLIIGGGAFLFWHWKRTGNIYPWFTAGQSAANGSSSPNISTSASEVGAGSNQNVKATQNQDKNAMRSAEGQQQPSAAPDAKPVNGGTPPVQDAHTVQNDDSAVASNKNQEPQKAPASATSSSSASSSTEPPDENGPSSTQAAAGAKKAAIQDTNQKVAKASLRQPAPEPKDTQVKDAQKDKQDPLFIQGQRYLYGTGVRQNCELAQKSMMTAAENLNTQAQSTLATMYATGHCVPRSLPLAYRWFAKASHQEPNNRRIEQDLEILWKQMTPEEKQIAMKSR
jgi:hypothetical protein